jgi:alginate O-acetyltransferase complex protein AlgI
MIFNSYEFILLFLPLVLAGFFVLGHQGQHRAAVVWLVASSFFYYGWWNPSYLVLLALLILFNYATGMYLVGTNRPTRRAVLIAGIVVNLATLAYYKYVIFFLQSFHALSGETVTLSPIVLPLAISFFTFQKVAYLVDAYRGEAPAYRFADFCLFVMFFPQLIAGPIVHHKEILPQFADKRVFRFDATNLSVGITIFVIGLCKKVLLADSLAEIGNPVFAAANDGLFPTFAESWIGALAYTLQLYFDFSGYSDMAIGIARMFGILLPLNFNSPYKADNIIDFWRRWHITLSRFLRDYLYIPLGGGRRGSVRRHANLLITMLLGGLWHGANWTFVFWGGLHGLYLVINHAWQALGKSFGFATATSRWWTRYPSRVLTFFAVVVAWVFFKTETFNAASHMLQAMFGLQGFRTSATLFRLGDAYYVPLGILIVGLLPNTQQFMSAFRPALEFDQSAVAVVGRSKSFWPTWQPRAAYAVLLAIALVSALIWLPRATDFIYYQF